MGRGRGRIGWFAIGFGTCTLLLFLTLAGVVWSQPAAHLPPVEVAPPPKVNRPPELVVAAPAAPSRAEAPLTAAPQQAAMLSPDLDLALTLVGSDTVETCDRVTYTLYITNNDVVSATQVYVSDQMPAGIAPYSVQTGIGYPNTNLPGGTFDGVNTVTWTFASLGPGNSLAVWIKARTYAGTVGQCLTNLAWLDADEIEIPIPMSDVACVRACQSVAPTRTPTPLPGLTTLVIQKGTFGDSEDTYIYRYAPNANYSTGPLLKAGYKQTNASSLRFALPALPAGAVVHRASLQLWAAGWGGSDLALGVYGISRTVSIDQATWNEAQTGNPWGLAGVADIASDRRGEAEDTLTTCGPSRWYGFDLTKLVQDWYGGAPNEGVLLRAGYSTAAYFFASSEAGDVLRRPRLVMQYYVPSSSPVIVQDEPILLPTMDLAEPTSTPEPAPPEPLEPETTGTIQVTRQGS